MKYRVTKGKSFTEDGNPVEVGHVFEADEVPAFLVGKVEEVIADKAEEVIADKAEAPADPDPAASIKPAVDASKK